MQIRGGREALGSAGRGQEGRSLRQASDLNGRLLLLQELEVCRGRRRLVVEMCRAGPLERLRPSLAGRLLSHAEAFCSQSCLASLPERRRRPMRASYRERKGNHPRPGSGARNHRWAGAWHGCRWYGRGRFVPNKCLRIMRLAVEWKIPFRRMRLRLAAVAGILCLLNAGTSGQSVTGHAERGGCRKDLQVGFWRGWCKRLLGMAAALERDPRALRGCFDARTRGRHLGAGIEFRWRPFERGVRVRFALQRYLARHAREMHPGSA